MHEVVYVGDPERHFMKGGVIEALDRAKENGLVRFVGSSTGFLPGASWAADTMRSLDP